MTTGQIGVRFTVKKLIKLIEEQCIYKINKSGPERAMVSYFLSQERYIKGSSHFTVHTRDINFCINNTNVRTNLRPSIHDRQSSAPK